MHSPQDATNPPVAENFRWVQMKDLNYGVDGNTEGANKTRLCSWCAKPLSAYLMCSRCKLAVYCKSSSSSSSSSLSSSSSSSGGNSCQKLDWKFGKHKHNCAAMKTMSVSTASGGGGAVARFVFEKLNDGGDGGADSGADSGAENNDDSSESSVEDPLLLHVGKMLAQSLFIKVRMYLGPFHVCNQTSMGVEDGASDNEAGIKRGFVFLQSGETAAVLTLPATHGGVGISHGVFDVHEGDEKPPTGAREPRMVRMSWLTVSEFDKEVIPTASSFELGVFRERLNDLVETYDLEKEVVVLTRFRCGFVGLGVMKLCPDFGVCLQIGKDYIGRREVGLEIDE